MSYLPERTLRTAGLGAWAASSNDSRRVRTIGFNTNRLHQSTVDTRYLTASNEMNAEIGFRDAPKLNKRGWFAIGGYGESGDRVPFPVGSFAHGPATFFERERFRACMRLRLRT